MDYRMKLCIYLLRYMFSMKASAVPYKVGELKKQAMGFGCLLAFGGVTYEMGDLERINSKNFNFLNIF